MRVKILERLENAMFHFFAAFSTFHLVFSDPDSRVEKDRNEQYRPLVLFPCYGVVMV